MMAGLIDDAYLLLDDSGRNIVLNRKSSGGVYDPAENTYTEATFTDYTFRGVLLNYRNAEFRDSLIVQGDRKIILSAKGAAVTPETADTLTVGNDVYDVISVVTIEERGQPVIFICQSRLT
jgi:hypothetical protein